MFTVEQWTGRDSLVCPWQEGEESGKHTQGVGHGTDPAQGTRLLLFITFLVADS